MIKTVVFLGLVALSLAAQVAYESDSLESFQTFKAAFGKTYESAKEEAHRYSVFQNNVKLINEQTDKYNAGKSRFLMGVNQFADLTSQEFAAIYLPAKYNRTSPRNEVTLPVTRSWKGMQDTVDWRTKGAVTPVKNQGQCGSCWSFSTTGSVEGAAAIATGKLVSLSEQELMDCSTAEGNMGCNGGLMDNAFKFIIKNGGLDTESDYPYTARDGSCNSEKEAKHAVAITGFNDVPHNSEEQMKAAVAKGPVSIAIEADKPAFQMYKSGVFDDANCGHQLDHGVLCVGYGTDYWIVKNSWGASWGDQGYIMMAQGVSAEGICGMLMEPSYPTGASEPATTETKVAAAPSNGDYEDPNAGPCGAGEEAVQITGISGSFCSPSCSATSPCPTDVPAGTTAKPECVLEKAGSSQPTNCALICNPAAESGGCPDNASCKPISGVGVCTYDS